MGVTRSKDGAGRGV